MQNLSETTTSRSSSPTNELPAPPPSLVSTPHKPALVEPFEGTKVEASPARSVKSTYMHIPEYLGMVSLWCVYVCARIYACVHVHVYVCAWVCVCEGLCVCVGGGGICGGWNFFRACPISTAEPFLVVQDFREVLDEYRLFHIVILGQDVRTLLVR